MKFPLPSPGTIKFTIYCYPREGMKTTVRDSDYFYDSGLCHGCGRKHERTARVEGFPSLCKDCYQNVYEYSKGYDDPLKLKKLKKGEVVTDELTREVISTGKKMAHTQSMMAAGIAYDFVYGKKQEKDAELVETDNTEGKAEIVNIAEKVNNAQKNYENQNLEDSRLIKEKLQQRDRLARQVLHQLAVPYPLFYKRESEGFNQYLRSIAQKSNEYGIFHQSDTYEKMYRSHPTLEADYRLLCVEDRYYYQCLIYRNDNYIRMANMRDKLIKNYRIEFPFLTEDSAYIDDEHGVMYLVLFYYILDNSDEKAQAVQSNVAKQGEKSEIVAGKGIKPAAELETKAEFAIFSENETVSKSKTKKGFSSWPLWLKILTIILLMNPVGVVVVYVLLVKFFWSILQSMRKDNPVLFWFLFIVLLWPPFTLCLGFFIGIGMLVQIIFG